MKTKTMSQVWIEDLHDAHLIKVKTNAKNLPDVWHEAIILLKKYIKAQEDALKCENEVLE